MTWLSGSFASGTLPTQTAVALNEVLVTGAASTWVGRFIVVKYDEIDNWEAAVIVSVSGTSVIVDKFWERGQPASGDTYMISEDAEEGEAEGDYSEDSNSNERGYQQKSSISMTGTSLIGFVGIKTDTFDVSQSTSSGPWNLTSGSGDQVLALSAMQFNTRSGGSSSNDGNEIIDIGVNGKLFGNNTSFHSIQNTIMRMSGEGAIWLDNCQILGMTRWELRGRIRIVGCFLEGRENALDIIELDLPTARNPSVDMLFLDTVFKNMNGFGNQVTASEDHAYQVTNSTFLNPSPAVVHVENNRTWLFVNCIWDRNSTTIDFNSATNTPLVGDFYGLVIAFAEIDGTPIDAAESYVHEELLGDNLPVANQLATDVNGIALQIILRELYSFPASVFTSTIYGDFSIKVGKHGFQPVILPLTVSRVNETITSLLTTTTDDNISETTAATAITNGSGISILRYATGETFVNPVRVFHYDGGTGSVPTFLETITIGGATGRFIEILGDAVSGFIVLDQTNAVVPGNNVTMSGSVSTFNGVSDTTGDTDSFYGEYTWLVDAAGTRSLQTVYDYLSAFVWQSTITTAIEQIIVWFSPDNAGKMLQTVDGDNFNTLREISRQEGVWVSRFTSGVMTSMVADDGTVFVPPDTVPISIQILDEDELNRQGAHVFLEIVDTGPPESTVLELINEKTPVSGLVSTSFTGTTPVTARRRVRDSSGTKKYRKVTDLVTIGPDGLNETIRLERQPILEGQN